MKCRLISQSLDNSLLYIGKTRGVYFYDIFEQVVKRSQRPEKGRFGEHLIVLSERDDGRVNSFTFAFGSDFYLWPAIKIKSKWTRVKHRW